MGVDEEAGPPRFRGKRDVSAEKKTQTDSKILRPDRPCHKLRDSLPGPSFTNFKGAIYLSITLVVLSNTYVVLKDIREFGFLINPFQWMKIFVCGLVAPPLIPVWLGLNCFPFCSLGLEILLSKGVLSEKIGLTLITLLLTLEISIPPLFAIDVADRYIVAFCIVLSFLTVFLKLVSYHMVNYWCRRQKEISRTKIRDEKKASHDKSNAVGDKDSKLVQYPDNLNLKDIYYLLLAPTLCYELNFPRLPSIRKGFLIKRVLELFCLWQLVMSVMQQSFVPTVEKYQSLWKAMDYFTTFEIYAKLCVPFSFLWLGFVYIFFYAYLNSLAEILRFGDRHYYGDWWNAESMPYLWKNWNMPVHMWGVRHVYIPVLELGFSKLTAVSAVFIVSGIFHEYLFSFPLKIFKLYIFGGMLTNIIHFLGKPSRSVSNNVTVWMSFIVCSPAMLLVYYYNYYVYYLKDT